MRSRLPRFQGENAQHNLALVDQLRAIAAANGASVAQLAIAWVLSRGPDIVPLIGARTRGRLEEALAAQTLASALSSADLERVEQAVPAESAAGGRYAEAQMADLDSER